MPGITDTPGFSGTLAGGSSGSSYLMGEGVGGFNSRNLIGAGLTGLTSGLLNQPTQINGNGTSKTVSSGTATTQRNLTPYQTQIQGPLFDYIRNLMMNPSASIAPFQSQARNNVNANYNGLADSLRQKFLSMGGGGGSGKFGTALAQGELQRYGDLSNVDNSFAQQGTNLQMTAAQLAQQLLGMDFGSTVNQNGTQDTTTTQQQTQKSGNGFLSGLAGLAGSLASAFI